MKYSSSDETHTNECSTKERKKKMKQRSATMMTRLTQVCISDDKLSIEFNDKTLIYYGTNSFFLRIIFVH